MTIIAYFLITYLFSIIVIHLEKSFTVSSTEHPNFPKKFPNTFALNTASRNFYIHADSEEMQKKWTTHIDEAIRNSEIVSIVASFLQHMTLYIDVGLTFAF